MRKKSLASLVLISVLMLMLSTMTVFASEGWKQTGSTWNYYNSNGSTVKNEWKKGADNLWRYLDSSGNMAVNAWVEDEYYVDANGILVADKWMKLPEKGSSSDEYVWYYFGSSGKVVTDTWKKIDNKWYYFDDEGVMQTGWVDEDKYYIGSDGVMKTGWQRLAPPDENDDGRVTPADETGDGTYWYYFQSSGKKYVPDLNNGSDYGEKKIDGVNYCFDEHGALQTGWVNVGSDDNSDAPISDYRYLSEDGKAITGWYATYPPTSLDGYDYSVEWFYFDRNGVPKEGPAKGEATTKDLVKINNITYLFNDRGTPVFGLQKVYTSTSKDEYTAYYFGDRKTSSVVKGKKKIVEDDGSETDFYFSDTGRGYTGVRDNYLYYMGKLQKAEKGTKYQVISIPNGDNYNNYVVNTSGKVTKSNTVKNADGIKLKTNASGILTHVDEEAVGKGLYNLAIEPYWTN